MRPAPYVSVSSLAPRVKVDNQRLRGETSVYPCTLGGGRVHRYVASADRDVAYLEGLRGVIDPGLTADVLVVTMSSGRGE